MLFKFWRARKNADRSSRGKFVGNSCVAGAAGSVSVAGSDGAGVGSGFENCNILGLGITNKGFPVRIIRVVVATYIGMAARINMPKTNPAKPRSSA